MDRIYCGLFGAPRTQEPDKCHEEFLYSISCSCFEAASRYASISFEPALATGPYKFMFEPKSGNTTGLVKLNLARPGIFVGSRLAVRLR